MSSEQKRQMNKEQAKMVSGDQREAVNYTSPRFQGVFTFNLSSIGKFTFYTTLGFFIINIIDRFIIFPVLGTSFLGSAYAELTDGIFKEITTLRIFVILLCVAITSVFVFRILPNSPSVNALLVNFFSRTVESRIEIPITHKEGSFAYNGKRKIVLVGESPHFMTFNLENMKSVVCKSYTILDDRIEIELTNVYTVNSLMILAYEELLERFPDVLYRSLKENISHRTLQKAEIASTSATLWKEAKKTIHPHFDYKALDLDDLEKSFWGDLEVQKESSENTNESDKGGDKGGDSDETTNE